MDLYDSRYFSLNKFLGKCIGIWPFDSKRKYFIATISLSFICAFMVPHCIGLFVNFSNVDRFMEHICIGLFLAVIFLKLFTVVIAEDKMKMMFNDIINNWGSIHDETERTILKKYSETGRNLTIAYIAYIAVVGVIFIFLPLSPIVINYLRTTAEPLPRLFLMNAEFLVDRNKHYWKIYFWDLTTTSVSAMIVVTVDTTFAACAEHCVGLCAIVRHRLQMPDRLTYDESTKTTSSDTSYDRLIKIVQLHHRVLRFTDTLEAAYSICFLVIMIANFILIPLICVMIIMNSGQTIQMVRYFMIFTGLAVHLFYLSLAGQKIIDCSTDLLSDAYFNEWYKGSRKTKQTLIFFMLRCTQPSMLTAGGLMIMGMETYFKFIGAVVNSSDIDKLMEHICGLLVLIATFFKLLSVVLAEDKMKTMFCEIVDNWQSIDDAEEKIILKKYLEKGRTLTVVYAIFILSVNAFFALAPGVPKIVNEMKLTATPLPELSLLIGEFLVDRNDYYWEIYFFEVCTTTLVATVVVTVDTTFAACVEQCLGLFAVIRHRLRKPDDSFYKNTRTTRGDASYDHLVKIIRLHQKALRFTDTVEIAYSNNFFMLMTASLAGIPLMCVMILMNTDKPINMIRFTLLFVGLGVHLLYLSLAGQKIIDSSSELFLDTYCNHWYESSMETKKILRIFMIRCTEPCVLTAGGLMIMGMETYFKMMKTSLSYITVIASFR